MVAVKIPAGARSCKVSTSGSFLLPAVSQAVANNARRAERALLGCFYCTWTDFRLCSVINCAFKNKVQNTSQEVWGRQSASVAPGAQRSVRFSLQRPQIQLALATASLDPGSCSPISSQGGCRAMWCLSSSSQASPMSARQQVLGRISPPILLVQLSLGPGQDCNRHLPHGNYGKEEPCTFPDCLLPIFPRASLTLTHN